MAAHDVFIIVLGVICKDVPVVGIVFQNIAEFILVNDEVGLGSSLSPKIYLRF